MTADHENQPSENSTGSLDRFGSSAVSVVLFFAVHALLLDCAFETQLAQSPLRWWVSGTVAIYFAALAAVYWRAGGPRAVGLLRPGTLIGIVILIALICGSSLHSAGMSDGVRLLGMTTSTVQIVVTMIGISLFGVLSYLTVQIDHRLRIAAGVIAIYCLISFLLGLVYGTPYVDLLQGSAFWSVLPLLLQGCVLGALLILPLALMHQISRRIMSDQGLDRQSWSARTICGALCVLLAFQGVFYGPGKIVPTGVAQSAENLQPLDRGPMIREAEPVNVSAGDVVEKFDDAMALLADASDLFEKIPLSPGDVVKQIGSDPVDLYQWVRNNTAFVPYRGVLRGPEGVMMDRDGNALDRALLLHRLLTLAGHRSRLASGTLDDESAAQLVSNSELATSRLAFSSIELTDTRVKGARERVTIQAGQIIQLLEHSPPATKIEAVAADVIADHWWVQVQNGEQWDDMDPLATGPEKSLTAATATFTEETLPENMFQQVSVRLLLETRGKKPGKHVLTEISQPAHSLAGKTINLGHVPLGVNKFNMKSVASVEAALDVMAETNAWVPLLAFEGSITRGLLFTESGEVMEPTEANIRRFSKSRAMSNIQKEMLERRARSIRKRSSIKSTPAGESTDAAAQPSAPKAAAKQPPAPFEALVSEWIEIEVSIPGGDRNIVRRVLFDDRTTEQDADDSNTTSPTRANSDHPTQHRKVASFLRSIHIATETAKLSGASLTRRFENKFSRMTELRNLIEHRNGKLAPIQVKKFIPVLRTLQTDLDYLAYLRWKIHPGGDDLFLAQPGITLLDRSINELGANNWVTAQSIDIAMNPVEVRPGSTKSPFNTRLAQGVADTISEALIHPTSDLPINMSLIHDMAVGHGVGFKQLSPGDKDEVEILDLPQAAKVMLKQDLLAGHHVLVPKQLIDFDTGYASWWRIDPVTGNTLGMISSGAGGAFAPVLAQGVIGYVIVIGIILEYYMWAFCVTGGQDEIFFFVSIKGAGLGERLALCTLDLMAMNALFAALFKILFRNGDEFLRFMEDEAGHGKIPGSGSIDEPLKAHRQYPIGTPVPEAEARFVGMNAHHLEELRITCDTDNLYQIGRASKEIGRRYHGKPGYASKQVDVKWKTKEIDGLVHVPGVPKSPDDLAQWKNLKERGYIETEDGLFMLPDDLAQWEYLKERGYMRTEDLFLLDPDGKKIFGDHDLMGVYDQYGKDAWSKEWNDMINENVFGDIGPMQRHGGNDNFLFPDYHNPYGPGIPGRLPDLDEYYWAIDPNGTLHIFDGTGNLEEWYKLEKVIEGVGKIDKVRLRWRY